MPPIKTTIRGFFSSGHERTQRIRKSVVYTLFSRGMSVAIGFALVRLSVQFVNPVQYGMWLIIASIVTWMNTFDIGLSNGLRNKIAHAIAVNQQQNIVPFISTTYAFLFLIAAATFGLFFALGTFFNWNSMLNLPAGTINIWPLLLITLGLFCLQFVLQVLNSILSAIQQSHKVSLIQMCGQALALISILVLSRLVQGNLYLLVTVVAGAPVLTLLLAHLLFFNTSLKTYRPTVKAVNLRLGKGLFSLGGMFFLIQVGALILYETDNLVITSITGPLNVTRFNFAYKYFSLLTIGFSVIITPYWSAFTDAFAKNDFDWIKNALRRMRLMWLGFVALAILLCVFSNTFYKIWLGNSISVPFMLTVSIAVYTALQIWTDIHAYLLNGIGKLRVQLILVIATGIVNIPLSVFLIKRIGLHGTVIANIMVLLIINIFLTWQSQMIIHRKARGIWNK